jgi:hypothetical protein
MFFRRFDPNNVSRNPMRHPFVRLAVVLAIGIALPSTAPSAARQADSGRRVTPTNVTAITAAEFFAPAKVWTCR